MVGLLATEIMGFTPKITFAALKQGVGRRLAATVTVRSMGVLHTMGVMATALGGVEHMSEVAWMAFRPLPASYTQCGEYDADMNSASLQFGHGYFSRRRPPRGRNSRHRHERIPGANVPTGPANPRGGGIADRGCLHYHQHPASDAIGIAWTPPHFVHHAAVLAAVSTTARTPRYVDQDDAEAVGPKVAGGRGGASVAWR